MIEIISHVTGCVINTAETADLASAVERLVQDGAVLDYADLRRADLRGCLFTNKHSRLFGADFRGAQLCAARFQGTGFDFAKMQFSNLDGVRIYNEALIGVNFCHSTMDRAAVQQVRFTACDFTGCRLRGGLLHRVSFIDCELTDADFTSTGFQNVFIVSPKVDIRYLRNHNAVDWAGLDWGKYRAGLNILIDRLPQNVELLRAALHNTAQRGKVAQLHTPLSDPDGCAEGAKTLFWSLPRKATPENNLLARLLDNFLASWSWYNAVHA